MSMSFGLIGTGYWARTVHGRALSDNPETDLVGVWGRTPAHVESVSRELGTSAYPDLDALLDDVDAVAIAVPPDAQADFAVRAADKGRHVLLDKPLALSSDGAERVVAAVERAGVRNLVFFTLRFTSSVARWLEGIPAAPSIRSARVRLHTSIYEPDNPYGASPWRQKHGALWDIGPHALSVLLPVLGPVTDMRALRGRDDEVEVITKHASGSIGSMSLSLTSPPADRSAQWSVYGADTTFVMPDSDEAPTVAYRHMIDDLLAARSDAWSHPCDVHFAREVTHVLANADRMLRDGN
jgi:predicted dehydrogenase